MTRRRVLKRTSTATHRSSFYRSRRRFSIVRTISRGSHEPLTAVQTSARSLASGLRVARRDSSRLPSTSMAAMASSAASLLSLQALMNVQAAPVNATPTPSSTVPRFIAPDTHIRDLNVISTNDVEYAVSLSLLRMNSPYYDQTFQDHSTAPLDFKRHSSGLPMLLPLVRSRHVPALLCSKVGTADPLERDEVAKGRSIGGVRPSRALGKQFRQGEDLHCPGEVRPSFEQNFG